LLRVIFGILAGFYLVVPNGGLIELAPDALPLIGHLDELAASYLLLNLFGAQPGMTQRMPSMLEIMLFGFVGLVAFIYLIYPSASLAEFIPDIVPFVGNLDEFLASTLVLASANTARTHYSGVALPATTTQVNHDIYPEDAAMTQDTNPSADSVDITPPDPAQAEDMIAEDPMTEDVIDDTSAAPQKRKSPDESAAYRGPLYPVSPPVILQNADNRSRLVAAVASVAIVAMVLGFCSLPFFAFSNLGGGISAFFSNAFGFLDGSTRISVDVSDAIVNSLRSRSMLVSAEAQMADARVHVDIECGVLNACGYGAWYTLEGTVFAGVNLNSRSMAVSAIGNNRYRIELPAPELTSCSLGQLFKYDETTTLVDHHREPAREIAVYHAIAAFVEQALEQGILEQATVEADQTIRDLLSSVAPDAQFEIIFAETDQVQIDDTCQPPPPHGYDYYEDEHIWRPT